MNLAFELDRGRSWGLGFYHVAEIRTDNMYQPAAIILMFGNNRVIIYAIPDRFFKKPTV